MGVGALGVAIIVATLSVIFVGSTAIWIEPEVRARLESTRADAILSSKNTIFINAKQEAAPGLPGLDLIGKTIDYWNGSFSAASAIVFKKALRSSFRKNAASTVWSLPDEVVAFELESLTINPEVSVESNILEFAEYEQRRFGLDKGFQAAVALGGYFSIVDAANRVFSSNSSGTAHVDVLASRYQLSLLPPQYVSLRPDILSLFSSLPRYDNSSRDLWLSSIARVGTHIVSSIVMGGRLQIFIQFDSNQLLNASKSFISEQSNLLFVSSVDPDPAKRAAAEARMDGNFKKASTSKILLEGGNSSEPTEREAWLNSLSEFPVWIRLETRELQDYFPVSSQVRSDVATATKEYLFSKLSRPRQDLVLGPEFDAATLARGAKINVSSIRTECNGRCWADNLGQGDCVDSNCDHPCCDPSQTCMDSGIRQCVCEIDAYCCDNWDDDCNKRVVSAGCVNCNCIRRKWDVLGNNNAGGCEVLVSTQQFCEDEFRGNGRWEVICVIFDNQNDVLTPGNQERFIFNAKDPAQTAKVSLGKEYFSKRVIAEVSPPPDGERFVSQTKVTDDRGHVWGFWGPSGPPVNRTNEAVEPWCLVASEFLFEFGPAHDLVGSMIYGLRVLAIEDSTPAGFIDSISRFAIVGWAFDPIAPERVLSIDVFVDGVLLKTGSTGVDRPDIVATYGLPTKSSPGFHIPISLFGAPARILTIHVEWIGVYRRRRSENVTFWTMQPPGQLSEVKPSFARGWAYLVDFPANQYTVEIWANGARVALGQTGTVSSPIDSVLATSAKYGFEIPLQLNQAILYSVTARVLIPGISESFVMFEQTTELDLRYPLGAVYNISAGYIEGWAINPAFPHQPVEVEVYLDDSFVGVGVTNVTNDELNKQYLLSGAHSFSLPIRMQGGRLHTISTYVNVNGILALVDEVKFSLSLEDMAQSRLFSNDALNFLGSGFNPCFNEWRLRAVEWSFSQRKLLNTTEWASTPFWELFVPDQFDIQLSPNVPTTVGTRVFSNISEWGAFAIEGWPFAALHGVVGGGLSPHSRLVEDAFSSFPNQKYGFAQVQVLRYDLHMSSPRLSAHAALEAQQLLPYNEVNRPLYFRFFDKFGTAFAESLSLGAKVVMEVPFAQGSNSSTSWEAEQVEHLLTWLTTNTSDPRHHLASSKLDSEFINHARPRARFIGGSAEHFNVSDTSSWLQTADRRLSPENIQYANIWDLVTDPQRRGWIESAALDYVRLCTPEHWLCSLDNVALRSRGAQVIGVSSRFFAEPDIAVFNLISPAEQQQSWKGDGESHFLFADGDPLQYILLQLKAPTWVSKVSVELDPYPNERGVWDFVRVDWSSDLGSEFRVWGISGEQNGRVEIMRDSYSFSVPEPRRVQYLRFVFGSVRPETRKGARIRRLYVFSCSNLNHS